MKAPRRTLIDRLMDDKIRFGGRVTTRRRVVEVMKAEGQSTNCIDWFAFSPQALPDDTPEDVIEPQGVGL